jgi:hypothetical protein
MSFELAMRRWVATVTAAALMLACDRGSHVRGVSSGSAADAPTAAGNPPASSGRPDVARPSSAERWPARDGAQGQQFTAGIVDYAPPPREAALLTDVRAARHDGFDRVVFEFGSGSAPGYHLEYIDRPVRKCGSGETTPIDGDAWLQVRFTPANAHTPSGAPTIADRNQTVDVGIVKELEQTCDFEAVVVWVVGVARPNAYRVLALNDPMRLVVDVKH